MPRSLGQMAGVMQERLRQVVRPDGPGAVLLISSGGEGAASATAGLASIEGATAMTTRTPFDTGSVAKIVTGLAVAILEEEGRVVAFVYRDPDGDRREDLRFVRAS